MTEPDYDPLYVAARSVLLDALEGLGSQKQAVIVVGAQAVYLRTGDAGITQAPYTTDADLALTPDSLTDAPLIEQLMRDASFSQEGRQPGSWGKLVVVNGKDVDIPVDIMVPEGLAPAGGRRSVQIDPHDNMAARKAPGLEGAAIDNDEMVVLALDSTDSRSYSVRVAGPAALVVAKLYKLHDRLEAGNKDRIADKDAADVYRIMQTVPLDEFMTRLTLLLDDAMAGPSTDKALGYLAELFGARANDGVQMAVEALRLDVPAAAVEEVCTSFTRQVRDQLGRK